MAQKVANARDLLLSTPEEFVAAVVSKLEVEDVYSLVFTLDKALFHRLMTQSIRSLVIGAHVPIDCPLVPPLVRNLKLRALEMTINFDLRHPRRQCLEWIRNLPNTLQSLKVSMHPYTTWGMKVELYPLTEKIKFFWPTNLESLELGGYLPGLAFGTVGLPKNLVRLVLSSTTGFPVRLVSEGGSWMPPYLQEVQFPLIEQDSREPGPLLLPNQLSAYPRTLTSISLVAMSQRVDDHWSPEMWAALPPCLTFASVPVKNVMVDQLPRTLHSLGSMSDQWTPESLKKLPPGFRNLTLAIPSNSTFNERLLFIQSLPRSLTRLSLRSTTKAIPSLAENETFLSALPPNLLYLTYGDPLGSQFASFLPRSLISLLITCRYTWDDGNLYPAEETLKDLPPSLTYLGFPFTFTIRASSFVKLLAILPITIRTLLINAEIPDPKTFALLPPNLSQFVAYECKGLTEEIFQYVPPSIRQIILPKSFSVKNESNWFHQVPPTVKSIQCGSYGTQYTQHMQNNLRRIINPEKPIKAPVAK